jgi:exonuclease VII large subunit
MSSTRERFGNAVTHLEAVSPLSTLARGYSVTTATDGKVLKQGNRQQHRKKRGAQGRQSVLFTHFEV